MNFISLEYGQISVEQLNERLNELIASSGTRTLTFILGDRTNKTDISIIVTTFGSNKFLLEALDSIDRQDFEGTMELMISYNRGSETEIVAAIKKWLSESWRRTATIKLVIHDHCTLFRDRELMIKMASGEIISFLDYDNYYYVAKVRTHIELMEKHSIHFTFSNQDNIDSNGAVISSPHLRVPRKYRDVKSLLFQNFVDSNTIFMDRYFYENYLEKIYPLISDSFFDGIVEDYFFGLIGCASGNFEYVDLTLGAYRYHSSNITSGLYRKNSIPEYIRLAKYNERIYKTLIAISLINSRLKIFHGSLFSLNISLINEKNLQILSANSGFAGHDYSPILNAIRSIYLLAIKILYIAERLKQRPDSIE